MSGFLGLWPPIAYNAFIGIFLREKRYGYYVLFIIAVLMYIFSLNGLAAQFFWPDSPWINRYAVLLWAAVIGIASLQFTISFLETKSRFPSQHKLIMAFLAVWGFICLQIPLVRYGLVIKQIAAFAIVNYASLIVLGLIAWKRRIVIVRYYLLAWLGFSIGVCGLALSRLGFLSVNVFVKNGPEAGTIFLLWCLSLALADRINVLKQQEHDAQAYALTMAQEKERVIQQQNVFLEQTVVERTHALQRSRENLLALIENTDGSIWSVDHNFRLLTGNSRFRQSIAQSLGIEVTEGQDVLLLNIPQSLQDSWRDYYTRALEGEQFRIEVPRYFNKEQRYTEYRFTPIRRSDGQIIGVTVLGQDITERKLAEETLRAGEEQLRLVIDTVPLPVIVTRPDSGEVLLVN